MNKEMYLTMLFNLRKDFSSYIINSEFVIPAGKYQI